MENPKKKRNKRKSEKGRGGRALRSLLTGVLLLGCFSIFGYSVYRLWGFHSEYAESRAEYKELDRQAEEIETDGGEKLKEADLDELSVLNPDTAAWIQIPGTVISYPVMYTADNIYYLDHTFSGENSKAGSIFMEALNSEDFTDEHTIIYGHNMRDGSMFAGLKKWKDKSYYQKHPYLYLTRKEGIFRYEIFSCYTTEEDGEAYTLVFETKEEKEAFIESTKKRALYDTGVEIDTGDKILTLSTCTSNGEKRFVIHACFSGEVELDFSEKQKNS